MEQFWSVFLRLKFWNAFQGVIDGVITFTVCSYHVMYAFRNESILHSCLNVKVLLAQNRHKIWSLSDCNWTPTHNYLVHKLSLNHLAKLAKCSFMNCLWVWVMLQSVITLCSCLKGLFICNYWLIKPFLIKIFITSKTSLVLTHKCQSKLLIKLVAIKLGMWAEAHA